VPTELLIDTEAPSHEYSARVVAWAIASPEGETSSSSLDRAGLFARHGDDAEHKVEPSLGGHESRTGAWLRRALRLLSPEHHAGEVALEKRGVVLGSSTGGMDRTELAVIEAYQTGMLPANYSFSLSHAHHTLLDQVSAAFAARGPRYVVSTACSSGPKAIAAARRLLHSGECDLVLTGGVDALCKLTQAGFRSLGLVASGGCLPFTADRKGLHLGEGAALLVLTRATPAPSEGRSIFFVGSGESNDAYDQSAPHPEGVGAELAMRRALEDARLLPTSVDYINAHGTGTLKNDYVEGQAIFRVFGAGARYSSTKHITGHQLGAAGATEAIICIDALERCIWPINAKGARADKALPVPPLEAPPEGRAIRVALSNSFAFGGSNACLIFTDRPTPPRPRPKRRFFLMASAVWVEDEVDVLPAAEILPKRMRARSSFLSRLAAEVYSRLISALSTGAASPTPGEIALVFGSSYGELTTSLGLLRELSDLGQMSPLGFQASVHNTAVAQLTQVLQNHGYATALAAGEATFAMSLTDALNYLGAHGGDAAVLCGDEAGPRLLLSGNTFPAAGVGLLIRSAIETPSGAIAEIHGIVPQAVPNENEGNAAPLMKEGDLDPQAEPGHGRNGGVDDEHGLIRQAPVAPAFPLLARLQSLVTGARPPERTPVEVGVGGGRALILQELSQRAHE
jgi:3-oxoacyl-[acyl-carrier-protein] synthase I